MKRTNKMIAIGAGAAVVAYVAGRRLTSDTDDDRLIGVRESIRIELPVEDVYRIWRYLDALPRFRHNTEIVGAIENRTLSWRSRADADSAMWGCVLFAAVRTGRSTQLSVDVQYPAGRAPSPAIREDLRHFKQVLEAGEVPRTAAAAGEW